MTPSPSRSLASSHRSIFERSRAILVLSRKVNESIRIGETVELTVVDIRGDKVRLGFTAPRDIPIHRREVFDAIQSEQSGGE